MLRRARLSSWLCRRSPRSQVQEKRTKYSTVATTKRTTLLDLRKKYTEKKPLVLVTGYSSSDTSLIGMSRNPILRLFIIKNPAFRPSNPHFRETRNAVLGLVFCESAERSDCVDAILVGDSVAMVSLGHRDTTPVTMEGSLGFGFGFGCAQIDAQNQMKLSFFIIIFLFSTFV